MRAELTVMILVALIAIPVAAGAYVYQKLKETWSRPMR
jgi:hypothetical protein